jgi:hypothetical protein
MQTFMGIPPAPPLFEMLRPPRGQLNAIGRAAAPFTMEQAR